MTDIVRARAEAMWAQDRATKGLGMRLDDVAPGRARLSMIVADTMANGHGIWGFYAYLCTGHGGFIFSLADSAMAFAANPRGEPAVAQHAQITFIRPARVGETLVADCEERMHAGRSGMYDVRVTNAAGELVAEFRGHTRTIRNKAEG